VLCPEYTRQARHAHQPVANLYDEGKHADNAPTARIKYRWGNTPFQTHPDEKGSLYDNKQDEGADIPSPAKISQSGHKPPTYYIQKHNLPHFLPGIPKS
jgi:hypothetical protein